MRRLIRRSNYEAKTELERLIGYLVTRRSGLRLDKHHFDEIIAHFHDSGGRLEGLKDRLNSRVHYERLHESIDYVLKKYDLKGRKRKGV